MNEAKMTVEQLRTRLSEIGDQDSEATPAMILRMLGEGPPKIKEVNGRKVGIVTAELMELIDLPPDSLEERFSQRLVGHDRLVDLDFHVVGHLRDTIYLEVSGVEEPAPVNVPDELLGKIARDVLDVETLETRGSDRLDFHQVGVGTLKDALARAFEEGRKAAGKD